MNTKTPTPTTPIAELWRKFDDLHRVSIPFAMRICDPDADVPQPTKRHYAKQVDEMHESVKSIRAQLLERCKRVPDKSGYYTSFEFLGGTLHTQFRDTLGQVVIQSRHDNAETAKEISSAHAFWAWELDQRQKEYAESEK